MILPGGPVRPAGRRLPTPGVDTSCVQNDITIRLNRSIERKYKRTNNGRTMVNEQSPRLVPHDSSCKFKRANLAVTRSNLQHQCH